MERSLVEGDIYILSHDADPVYRQRLVSDGIAPVRLVVGRRGGS